MVEKFKGIVLRTLKYSDNLMIADIFTESRGRVSFLLPVTRSRNSKVKSVLFQPLSILHFQANYKHGGAMSRLSEALPAYMYRTIQCDPCKSAIALYLAEFLTRALHEESDNAAIFGFIEQSLMWLDEAEEKYANFHLLFLMRLTRYLGISPNLETGSRAHYFDLEAGCFVGVQPMHSNYLTATQAADFFSLMAHDYDGVSQVAMNRNMRNEYLTVIQNYYRLHIPDFPELKSADVLKELFL